MNEQLNTLERSIPQLPEGSRAFAADLVSKGRRYGLSDKQAYWVGKLIERATQQQQAPTAPVTVDGLAGVRTLFTTAAGNLRHPRIVIRVGNQDVKLSIAGPNSRYAGSVMVADNVPFGSGGNWYGHIDQQGRFHPSRNQLPGLVEKLREFADRPAATASAHGRLTGHCCFCHLGLTDPRSVAVGYGPICAGNWGLPWGDGHAALTELGLGEDQ